MPPKTRQKIRTIGQMAASARQRAVQGRAEAGGLRRDVRRGIDEALGEDRLMVRRQLAGEGLARDGRGDPVELIELAGDGLALRVELERASARLARGSDPSAD